MSPFRFTWAFPLVAVLAITANLLAQENSSVVPPPPTPDVGVDVAPPSDLPPPAVPVTNPQPAPAAPPAAAPAPGTPAGGPEVLTRGPVHEAFAQPVIFNPQPGPIVPKQPPEAIQEMPPDQKPAGQNVVWISGYWSWDDERKDFLWVSGIWRDLPPGQQWVPGYWAQVEGGYQWASGYWAPTAQEQVNYLPQPPQSIEAGPNVPSPGPEYSWVPGYWFWNNGSYAWRPGYWIAPQANWIWMPPRYAWTPGGYVFLPGYWDYPVATRGMVFAPVYFSGGMYAQPAFVYTPMVVIGTPMIMANFFARPAWGAYYFGDYYGATYASSGFVFSLSFGFGGGGMGYPMYSPMAAQYAYEQGRLDQRWADRMREQYAYRMAHEEARPARTFAAEQARIARGGYEGPRMGTHLADIANSRAEMMNARASMVASRAEMVHDRTGLAQARMERVDQAQRAQMMKQNQAVRQFQQQRLQHETQIAQARAQGGAAAAKAAMGGGPLRSQSPIAARPTPAMERMQAERAAGGAAAAHAAAGGGMQTLPNAARGEAFQQREAQVQQRESQLQQQRQAQLQQREGQIQQHQQAQLGVQQHATELQQQRQAQLQQREVQLQQMQQARQQQHAAQLGGLPAAGAAASRPAAGMNPAPAGGGSVFGRAKGVIGGAARSSAAAPAQRDREKKKW